jgi:hypothetical protein
MTMAWMVVIGEMDFEAVPTDTPYYFADKSDAFEFHRYMDEQSPSALVAYVKPPNYLEVKLPKVYKKGEWKP